MGDVRTPWTFGTPNAQRDDTDHTLYIDTKEHRTMVAERNPKFGIGDLWASVTRESTRDR